MPRPQPNQPDPPIINMRKYVFMALLLGGIALYRYMNPQPAAEVPNKPPAAPQADHETKKPDAAKPDKASPPEEQPKSETSAKEAPSSDSTSKERPAKEAPAKNDDLTDAKSYRVSNITVKDQYGNVVYTGTIDLTKTIERIHEHELLRQFRDDGIVFQNRERRLPQKPDGYYHEYVHHTPELDGPGPQRVIEGKGGELWYTADHYKSFKRIN